MAILLAVDPGEEHCGLAIFAGAECVWAGEKTPTDLYDWLAAGRDNAVQWDVVIVEEFRLYPAGSAAQRWSTFATVEVIGVLKEWCRTNGARLVMQPAAIKRPTLSILRAHGTPLRSRGAGPHAQDAEVHGWHYLLKGVC